MHKLIKSELYNINICNIIKFVSSNCSSFPDNYKVHQEDGINCALYKRWIFETIEPCFVLVKRDPRLLSSDFSLLL